MMPQLSTFDTHAAVKRLHKVGLATEVAEEVVASILLSRDYDISKLATKEEFFKFREDFSEHKQALTERFSKIDAEIFVIKQDVEFLKENMATKSDLSNLRKDLMAEISKSKNETLRWFIGLFIALTIAIFIKPHL